MARRSLSSVSCPATQVPVSVERRLRVCPGCPEALLQTELTKRAQQVLTRLQHRGRGLVGLVLVLVLRPLRHPLPAVPTMLGRCCSSGSRKKLVLLELLQLVLLLGRFKVELLQPELPLGQFELE